MKGDFSRLRFERTKHYTSVLEQQGRVALDADRNEQCAIDEHLRHVENTDIIGPFGGPQEHAGFGISVDGNTIKIGAGRYYVDGLLCENETPLAYGAQPYLIHPALTDSNLLADLRGGTLSAIRLFLEVWQRMVTALDDPCLREPALGQADTTTRLQTVWRVVAEGIPTPKPAVLPLPFVSGELLAQATSIAEASAPLAPVTLSGLAESAPPLTAVEPAAAVGPAGPPATAPAARCCADMYQPAVAPAAGTLSAQTTGASSDCSCEPTPAAGYRGLENQLYRVEIHRGGSEATATFKWSRENGSIVSAVRSVSGADVVVDSLGSDANLGFQAGEWVELSDDTYLFGPTPNQPGELFQIKSISTGHRTITMTAAVAQIDPGRNARVRRWEQDGVSATPNGVALAAGSWLELENGIQVQFAAGQFQPGDHWLIPARTATGQIEWPPCGGDGAAFQPPHRTEVDHAPLACIHWEAKNKKLTVEECRRFFPSLTEISTAIVPPAFHVTKISWSNDEVMTLDQLIRNGLVVYTDATTAGRVDSGNFAVSLEVPIPALFPVQRKGLPTIIVREDTPLDGQVMWKQGPASNLEATISWALSLDQVTIDFVNKRLIQGLLQGLVQGPSYGRVRVRLLGSKIFVGTGGQETFLDGESFGTAGLRADGKTPRTDLQFPSGNNQRASDFESWFYLAPIVQLGSLTLSQVAVKLPPATPLQATIAVNYPPVTDTAIALSVKQAGVLPAAVSVPATVTIPKGQTSATFDVTVTDTGRKRKEGYQIVATLPSSVDSSATLIAPLTVSPLPAR